MQSRMQSYLRVFLLWLLIHFLASWVLWLLVAQFLQAVVALFPTVFDLVDGAGGLDGAFMSHLQKLLGGLAAPFLAAVFSMELHKAAREQFLSDTDGGFLPPRQSLALYLRQDGWGELLGMLFAPVLLALLGLWVPFLGILTPLHSAAMWLFGPLLGALLATVWTALALGYGLCRAQNRWRVEQFLKA